MGRKSHFVREGVDELDPSKTSGSWKKKKAGKEVGTPTVSLLQQPGEPSASRPPEGARSLSELKPRRHLQCACKRCGVEGAATSERILLRCNPTLGVESTSVQRHFAPRPSTLAAPWAVTSGRLFVRPLLAFVSSTACRCSGLESGSEDRESKENLPSVGPGSA